MTELLTSMGSVVTQIITWTGAVVDLVVGEPLLLAFTGLSFFGGAIGLFKTLSHR